MRLDVSFYIIVKLFLKSDKIKINIIGRKFQIFSNKYINEKIWKLILAKVDLSHSKFNIYLIAFE